MKDIAFIGLGNMGGPMSVNLVKTGFRVTGFDVSPAAMAKWSEHGIAVAASAQDAVRDKHAIITMLATGEQAKVVHDEILARARPGTVVIDCSTIDVADARVLHGIASHHGLESLDAPVSGGVGGATAGTLTFMAGGEGAIFERARPLFEAMGSRAIHCGAAGSGQAAKICNNMLLGISMIGTCEAFNLADALGLDRHALFDVLSTSSGQCWSVTNYCPVPGIGPESPADRDYQPGFAASLMLKDLTLSQSAASDAGVVTPLGAHAASLYADFVKASGANRDFSAIIHDLAKARR